MPSTAASASTVGRSAREPPGGQPLHGHRLQERLEPEAADRARPAARREHVVAAGRVVAGRDGRAAADEDGARVADARRERLGSSPSRTTCSGASRLDLGERALEVAVASTIAADGVGAVLGLRGELELGDRAGRRRAPSTTTTSDGPAGRSIATSRETSSFASFTYALPGPTILSTRAIVSVP